MFRFVNASTFQQPRPVRRTNKQNRHQLKNGTRALSNSYYLNNNGEHSATYIEHGYDPRTVILNSKTGTGCSRERSKFQHVPTLTTSATRPRTISVFHQLPSCSSPAAFTQREQGGNQQPEPQMQYLRRRRRRCRERYTGGNDGWTRRTNWKRPWCQERRSRNEDGCHYYRTDPRP